MTLVELCAGTAAVSLSALAGVRPLTGYMGSKARYALELRAALRVGRPDRVVLVDAGPWGDVWQSLSDARTRRATAEVLDGWQSCPRPELWVALVSDPPYDDPPTRVAQYLWLQSRSAGTVPMWWSVERARWEAPTGSKTERAHQRGGRGGIAVERGQTGCRGLQHPATLARRVRGLDALPWDRITALRCDVREVEPERGSAVLLDPPYQGAPRYAELLPRSDVLEVARRHDEAGARVVVCEREPLDGPLPGWSVRRLHGPKPEWITSSEPLAAIPQLGLFA